MGIYDNILSSRIKMIFYINNFDLGEFQWDDELNGYISYPLENDNFFVLLICSEDTLEDTISFAKKSLLYLNNEQELIQVLLTSQILDYTQDEDSQDLYEYDEDDLFLSDENTSEDLIPISLSFYDEFYFDLHFEFLNLEFLARFDDEYQLINLEEIEDTL